MLHKIDKSSIDVQVKAVIEDIKSMHFLGSSNHKFDPTGGLSGYFRNVAHRVYTHYPDKNRVINPTLYPYLMMAALRHTGAGNCGEMAAALYTSLHMRDLTVDQKKSIELRMYDTKDAHVSNSYVLVGETVFDIWANKIYKKTRIKAETHVAEKYHQKVSPINPNIPTDQLGVLCESMYKKFRTEFDLELSKDRQTNRMYVTFDSTDPSDFALFANQAFPWLFTKFTDTVTNAYFKTRPELARDIQTKIVNHFIYLIEELRKDVATSMELVTIHPKQRTHSDDEIRTKVLNLLNNEYVVNWLMAMSYRDTQPKICLHSLQESLLSLASVEQNELVSLLISLSKETLMHLEISAPESRPAHEQLSDSDRVISTGSSDAIAQTSYKPSDHVAHSIFSSSSSSIVKSALDIIPEEHNVSSVVSFPGFYK
ncbi:hypothetical protein [Legionella quateirensis]|uniref:Uncharacterized protein n=1 Tax=Legionella quateirensis TaxID=45072 RepID=A0A378KRQ3_9GAMM|nr:hypothetical protein [Legionella quateirensis]KTD44822.1 hypothetical protein Lqua_2657 [Legionella quateirensis]STY16281.1 Uncharacterised protein [Legionella quateirensis]